jgi:hypothetical protein
MAVRRRSLLARISLACGPKITLTIIYILITIGGRRVTVGQAQEEIPPLRSCIVVIRIIFVPALTS